MSDKLTHEARDAAAEAAEVLRGERGRVLEPSPPAVVDDFFADDPVNSDPAGEGLLVSPVPNGSRRWEDVVADRPDLADFARDRWLGPYRRLTSPPADFAATRLSLHLVAAYVMSPARRRANGKIALRYTRGGFGTPFFGDDEQVRTEHGRLIVQVGSEATAIQIDGASLNQLGDFVGAPPDVEWASQWDIPEAGDLDAPLHVGRESARLLGDWYGFGVSVLEELRADAASIDDSRVQLWPEHFDPAFETLPEPRRASYGASPGDSTIDEPYLYVGPWSPTEAPDSTFWNTGFASFRLSELVDADDQRAAALDFLRTGRDLLAS